MKLLATILLYWTLISIPTGLLMGQFIQYGRRGWYELEELA